MRIIGKSKQTAQSAGKRVWRRCDWLWFLNLIGYEDGASTLDQLQSLQK